MTHTSHLRHAAPPLPRSPCRLAPAAWSLLLAAGGLCLMAGCGSDRPEMVSVRGKVTLAGGAWPKPGTLSFDPVEPAPGFPRRPGAGDFDTDGAFSARTGRYEGLIPGRYRIAVICWKREPSHEADGESYVPPRFANPSHSELELEVPPDADGPVEWNYDFPRAESSP